MISYVRVDFRFDYTSIQSFTAFLHNRYITVEAATSIRRTTSLIANTLLKQCPFFWAGIHTSLVVHIGIEGRSSELIRQNLRLPTPVTCPYSLS